MPYDAYISIAESTSRAKARERQKFCIDLTASISGSLTGKGLEDHLKQLEPES